MCIKIYNLIYHVYKNILYLDDLMSSDLGRAALIRDNWSFFKYLFFGLLARNNTLDSTKSVWEIRKEDMRDIFSFAVFTQIIFIISFKFDE